MDRKAAVLAMKAISYGIEKVPDEVFEKIPGGYFKAKEKEIDKKRNNHKEGQSSRRHPSTSPSRSGYSSSEPNSDYDDLEQQEARQRRRRRQRNRNMPRESSSERRYEDYDSHHRDSRHGVRWVDEAYTGQPYFPPPPREETTSPYKPYNPAEYGPIPSSRDHYNGYSPASPYPQTTTFSPPPGPPPHRGPYQPGPRSTAEARYRPMNYTPSPVNSPQDASSYQGYYNPPPFYRQPSYSNPDITHGNTRDDHRITKYRDSSRDRGRDRSQRDHSKDTNKSAKHSDSKRSHSVPRSVSNVREKLSSRLKKVDHAERNLVASIAGAVAGGLIGNEVGQGTLSTALGAALGGLAVGGLEKRHDMKKKKKLEERRDSGHADDSDKERHSRNKHDRGDSTSKTSRNHHDRRHEEVFDSDDNGGDSD